MATENPKSSRCDNPDDLEITSIGLLYNGPLDKKYWSCSRGKDRHPYPVGYHALRTHSGNTYSMKVLEGLKGPVFVITSSDGFSSSGQTPDIAWEKFQRESVPRVKYRNGKRFSSNIDGVELFGFRNPFVQRLLRELVANMYGVPGQLSSSNSENEALKLGNKKQDQDFHEYTNLLVYSKQKPATRKRSTKNETSAKGLSNKAGNRRVRFRYEETDIKSDISDQVTVLQPHDTENVNLHLPHSYHENDGEDGNLGVLSAQISANKEGDRNPILVGDVQVLELEETDQFVEKHVIHDNRNKHTCSEKSRLSYTSNHVTDAENILIDRSSGPMLKIGDLSANSKSNDGEIPDTESYSGVLIPDTCDTIKYDVAGFTSTCCEENLMSEDLCLPDDNISKRLIKDSLPEDASTSGSSDPSSQKDNMELAVQELTKSMMTFLLPSAVPLIKKTYKRRSKNQNRGAKSYPCSTEQKLGNKQPPDGTHEDCVLVQDPEAQNSEETRSILEVECQSTKMLHAVNAVDGLITYKHCPESIVSEDAKFMIPDSFEDDISMKRPSATCYQPANAASDGINGNIYCPSSLIDEAERDQGPSDLTLDNPEFNRAIPKNGLDKNEYLLSDSLAAYLEEEFNDELAIGRKEVSYDAACLGVKSKDDMSILELSANNDLSKNFSSYYGSNNVEEKLSLRHIVHDSPIRDGAFENFGQDFRSSGTREVYKSVGRQSLDMLRDPEEKLQRSSADNLVKFEVNHSMQLRDDNVGTVNANHLSQVGITNEAIIGQKAISSSLFHMPNTVLLNTEQKSNDSTVRKPLHPPHFFERTHVPLSESIICRNYKDGDGTEICVASRTSRVAGSSQARSTKNDSHQDEVKYVAGHSKCSSFDDVSVSFSEKNCIHVANELHAAVKLSSATFQEYGKDLPGQRSNILDNLSYLDKNSLMKKSIDDKCRYHCDSLLTQKHLSDGYPPYGTSSNKERMGNIELVGCYMHPNPVLSVFLSSKIDYLQICAVCGVLGSNHRYLFIYAVPLKNENGSCPSFVGYTEVVLPLLAGHLHRNGIIEKTLLQLTSDGLLVTINSIKAPHCRQRSIDCSCSFCKVHCCDENAIQVAQVKFGFVLPLTKLTTADKISCMLVCEPNYLLAAEVSGGLHIWLMNCNWSGALVVENNYGPKESFHLSVPSESLLLCYGNELHGGRLQSRDIRNCAVYRSGSLEEFVLPSFDDLAPVPVELKKVPNTDIFVVGHNGIGGFGLWDISKRVLLARFSAPGHMVFQILPVGLFSLHDKGPLATADHLKEPILVTNSCVPESSADHSFFREDVAVWILMLASSNCEAGENYPADPNTHSVRWRLALLAQTTVVMGSVVDNRASVVETLAGYGIIGTYEGLLYRWELLTGEKIENLHHFNCGSVFSAAVDDESGSVAVADDKSQLLVFTLNHGKLRS